MESRFLDAEIKDYEKLIAVVGKDSAAEFMKKSIHAALWGKPAKRDEGYFTLSWR